MAKRITTDAKIVLERAGYLVEYVYGKRNKVVALKVTLKHLFGWNRELPVKDGCWIDNDLVEELIFMDS